MPLLTTRRFRASKQPHVAVKPRSPRRMRPTAGTPFAVVGATLLLIVTAALARRLFDTERRQHLSALLASIPIIESATRRGRGER